MTKLMVNILPTVIVMVFSMFGVLHVGASDTADRSQNEEQIKAKLISRLNSKDANQRAHAVFEIVDMFQKGIVIKEAIPGLIKELERIDFAHLSEESGEYSGELIHILGEYKDVRAIPALLNGLGHVGGTSVTEGYAKIGPTLLDALFLKVNNESHTVRIDALYYIGKLPQNMIRYGYDISTDHKRKIKECLLSSLKDKKFNIRYSAIKAIDNVQSIYNKDELADFITLLESLSKNDPYIDKTENNAYSIRINAALVMNHLKTRQ